MIYNNKKISYIYFLKETLEKVMPNEIEKILLSHVKYMEN